MRVKDRPHTTLARVALVIMLDLATIIPVIPVWAASPNGKGDGGGKPLWPFLLGVVLFTAGIAGLICRWHIRRLVQRGERSDSSRVRNDMM